MLRTRQEWYDWCIERGTNGDQVFDILKDWKEEREKGFDSVEDGLRADLHHAQAERDTLSALVGLYHAVDDLLYHSASNSYPDDHHNPDHLGALQAVFLGMSVGMEDE